MEDGELIAVLKNFPVPLDYTKIAPQQQGYINRTFTLYYKSPRYILQHLNTRVFSEVGALMDNLARALPYLKDPRYTGPELIETKEGYSYLQQEEGSCWRLMTYVPDSVSYPYCPNTKTAWEAGKILGVFHQLMDRANPVEFQESLPGFHELEGRVKQFKTVLEKAKPERKNQAKEAIAFASSTSATLLSGRDLALPLRVCHNDTKMSNFLFSKTDGRGLCLIDLDTLMPGYFHYDFGDALRTIANAAPEEEADPDKIVFNRDYCEAFIKGLSSTGSFLSRTEIAKLPYGAQLMPFLHGIRALTDYLLGDVYYRVRYPQQNLDRALGLFRFAALAKEETSFMTDVIQKYFPKE